MDGTSRGAGRCHSPDSILFIDMANQSQASQASSRKKARAHIMNQRHRRARKAKDNSQCVTWLNHDSPLGGSGPEPPHMAAPSERAKTTSGEGRLPLITAACLPYHTTSRAVGAVLPPDSQTWSHHAGHHSVAGTWSTFDSVYQVQQKAASILWPRTLSLFGLSDLDIFPFRLNHRDQGLLFHYGTVLNYTNMPVNSKEEWIQYAVTDEALLHMTLVIAALHIALLRGKKFSVDAFRHQTRAIKLLYTRLNDTVLSITDPTILSISCLALTEVLNALPLEAASHLNAIDGIVRRRGGLQSLGFNGIVRRKVLWADLSSAISLQIPPRFSYPAEGISPSHQSKIIHREIDHSAMSTSCAGEVYNLMAGSRGPAALSSIIHDLESLAIVICHSDRSDMAKIDELMLSDHFYDVERRAYDILQAEFRYQHDVPSPAAISDLEMGTSSSFYTACCFTVLVYVPLALREIPPLAGLFNTLIGRLTTAMRDVEIMKACAACPKILLWILGTGGAAARGRKEREWYVMQFAELCQHWQLDEWESVSGAFGSPLHLAPGYVKELMSLWNEVEEFWLLRELE